MHTEPRNGAVRSANDARASHYIIRYTQIYIFTRVPVIPTDYEVPGESSVLFACVFAWVKFSSVRFSFEFAHL
jgi:hypothetical protein